jgi:hypothetical protein
MAAQQTEPIKARTIQSVEKEIEALLSLHDDCEMRIMELLHERDRMLYLMRGARA